MMQPYPLYDHLLETVRTNALKTIDANHICTTLNNITLMPTDLAKEHYDELFALSLHHDLVENDGILLSKIPHDGVLLPGGKSVLYTLAKLPNTLRQILVEYINYYY